jgi:hypothetical protein
MVWQEAGDRLQAGGSGRGWRSNDPPCRVQERLIKFEGGTREGATRTHCHAHLRRRLVLLCSPAHGGHGAW